MARWMSGGSETAPRGGRRVVWEWAIAARPAASGESIFPSTGLPPSPKSPPRQGSDSGPYSGNVTSQFFRRRSPAAIPVDRAHIRSNSQTTLSNPSIGKSAESRDRRSPHDRDPSRRPHLHCRSPRPRRLRDPPRNSQREGYTNFVPPLPTPNSTSENQAAVTRLLRGRAPRVRLPRRRQGRRHPCQHTYPADFIYNNLLIEGERRPTRRTLRREASSSFSALSCIYPASAPQPMREEHAAHRRAGAHQRGLRDRQDRRHQALRGVQPAVRDRLHLGDADEPLRPARQLRSHERAHGPSSCRPPATRSARSCANSSTKRSSTDGRPGMVSPPAPDWSPLGRRMGPRSVMASLLLGMHPPRLSSARLVRWCSLFGITENAAHGRALPHGRARRAARRRGFLRARGGRAVPSVRTGSSSRCRSRRSGTVRGSSCSSGGSPARRPSGRCFEARQPVCISSS